VGDDLVKHFVRACSTVFGPELPHAEGGFPVRLFFARGACSDLY
jgi:hypothetical protein